MKKRKKQGVEIECGAYAFTYVSASAKQSTTVGNANSER